MAVVVIKMLPCPVISAFPVVPKTCPDVGYSVVNIVLSLQTCIVDPESTIKVDVLLAVVLRDVGISMLGLASVSVVIKLKCVLLAFVRVDSI